MTSELDPNAAPDLPVNPSEDANNDVVAAIAQLKGEPAPTAPDKAAAIPAADTPPANGDRARNERGQFIKADGSVDHAAEAAKVPDADPLKANIAEPSKAVEAPAGWSAEAKAEFTKASPVVQAAVLKREAEMNEGGARWSEEKKTLLSHFEPLRGASERYKTHPAEVLKRLASANDYLERDAPAAIKWLADSYGVDLSKLATGQPAAAPSTPSQPQADPRLNELQSKVSQFEQRFEAEETAKVNGQISAFASAPGHEHFETVKADVGYLMLAAAQAGKELTLDQAYEQACWAAPDIRAKLIAAQTAPVDAAAKQREAAEKARRGTISAHGAPNGATTPPKVFADPRASVEDDVRAAIESLRH